MKSNNMFREQVNSVTSWFGGWSACEQTVALYSLLKQIPPLQCRFLVQMLQQRICDDKEMIIVEEEANDPVYLCKLTSEPKEKVIAQLLNHLPLLHSGNKKAKAEYLKLIPLILSHSIDNGVFIEESRQLLSYSLIHPAITSDERSQFNRWLVHLDERLGRSGQGQCDEGQGYSQGDNGITQAPMQGNVKKPIAVGSERINGSWNNYHFENISNGLDSQGQGQGENQSNLYSSRLQAGQPMMAPGINGGHGHLPLQATLSAPANFVTMVAPNSSQSIIHHAPPPAVPTTIPHHAPLQRTRSFHPPSSLPHATTTVSDWLKLNDQHLIQGQGHDHAPLSPQSSTASSGSGSDTATHLEDGQQPTRNTFMEERSGMRDVPLWLKGLRLHKYAVLFQQMTYEEMLNIDEDWLEHQNVTKGARNKIVLSIKKLVERQDLLRSLDRDLLEGGSIKNCIQEMKSMLNSPIKAFTPSEPAALPEGSPAPPGGGEGDNSLQEGDLPGHFTRLMTRVCTQLLTSPYDDEALNMYLQLIDKCINHEAFSQKQKKLLDSWKQQVRKIWQPAPYKYSFDKKTRPNWGNTYPVGANYAPRPIQRNSVNKTPPKPVGGMMWSFGAKRSVVGGTTSMGSGHLPVQRNNSHNPVVHSRSGVIEPQVKQPLTRTQSAPLHAQGLGFGLAPGEGNPQTDTEINARLDSLCRSMTESALENSDGNERSSAF